MKDFLKHLAVGITAAIGIILLIVLLSKLTHSTKDAKQHEMLLATQAYNYTIELTKVEEEVNRELRNHKINFEDQTKNLEGKVSSLELLLNKSLIQQSVINNERILSLLNDFDLLNKTLQWDMEHNYMQRELKAIHKEQDKHFPFDPFHNSCYQNFSSLQQDNTTQKKTGAARLQRATSVHGNISSKCALLVARSSTNIPNVGGIVNLTHSDAKYRLSIAGTVPPNTKRFTINIYTDEQQNLNILHISPWFVHERDNVINTRSVPGPWENEIKAPLYGLANGKDFKIVITYEENIFKIVVNDHEPILFHNRYAKQKSTLRKVKIHETVNIRLLTFEILEDPQLALIAENEDPQPTPIAENEDPQPTPIAENEDPQPTPIADNEDSKSSNENSSDINTSSQEYD